MSLRVNIYLMYFRISSSCIPLWKLPDHHLSHGLIFPVGGSSSTMVEDILGIILNPTMRSKPGHRLPWINIGWVWIRYATLMCLQQFLMPSKEPSPFVSCKKLSGGCPERLHLLQKPPSPRRTLAKPIWWSYVLTSRSRHRFIC